MLHSLSSLILFLFASLVVNYMVPIPKGHCDHAKFILQTHTKSCFRIKYKIYPRVENRAEAEAKIIASSIYGNTTRLQSHCMVHHTRTLIPSIIYKSQNMNHFFPRYGIFQQPAGRVYTDSYTSNSIKNTKETPLSVFPSIKIGKFPRYDPFPSILQSTVLMSESTSLGLHWLT